MPLTVDWHGCWTELKTIPQLKFRIRRQGPWCRLPTWWWSVPKILLTVSVLPMMLATSHLVGFNEENLCIINIVVLQIITFQILGGGVAEWSKALLAREYKQNPKDIRIAPGNLTKLFKSQYSRLWLSAGEKNLNSSALIPAWRCFSSSRSKSLEITTLVFWWGCWALKGQESVLFGPKYHNF